MANHERDRGRSAAAPWLLPWLGWRDVLLRVAGELGRDQVGFVAAAIAFYAMLALFPTLIAIVSLYGLAFDPWEVTRQITAVSSLLPPGVANALHARALSIVTSPSAELSVGFGLSLVAAFWSSSLGAMALIRGLNISYDEEETRTFVVLRAKALVFAAGLVLFVVVALGILAVVPSILTLIGVAEADQLVFRWVRWVVLGILVPSALTLAYRYAPSRRPPRWQWVVVGAAVASALWLVASWGLSLYVDHVVSLNETYGALSGGIVLMLWLYVSSFVVLVGAELNAELEHQTEVDSTIGDPRPIGERGAKKADSIGPVPPSARAAISASFQRLRRWARERGAQLRTGRES